VKWKGENLNQTRSSATCEGNGEFSMETFKKIGLRLYLHGFYSDRRCRLLSRTWSISPRSPLNRIHRHIPWHILSNHVGMVTHCNFCLIKRSYIQLFCSATFNLESNCTKKRIHLRGLVLGSVQKYYLVSFIIFDNYYYNVLPQFEDRFYFG